MKNIIQIIKTAIIIYFVIFINASIFGQKVISGTIREINTERPLTYVNVFIENSNIGTMTDELGEFNITIPKNYLKDAITFSYIGYENKQKFIENITNNIDVFLESKSVELNEVELTVLTGNKIMQNFFKNVRKNHSQDTFQKQGYMNYTFFDENECIAIGESTFVLDNNEIKHQKSRSIADNKRFSELEKLLGKKRNRKVSRSGHNLVSDILKLEVINHVKPSSKKKKKETKENSNFEFIHDGYKDLNNRLNYVILFKYFHKNKAVFKGRILIDTETYGCSSYTIFIPKDINPQKLLMRSFFTRMFTRMAGFKILAITRELTATYKYQNDIWTLEKGKIITGGEFKIKKKKIKGLAIQEFMLYPKVSSFNNKTINITTTNFGDNFWGKDQYVSLTNKNKKYITKIKKRNQENE